MMSDQTNAASCAAYHSCSLSHEATCKSQCNADMSRESATLHGITAITNRHLCTGDFFKQIEKIAALHPDRIILREKDLSDEDYLKAAIVCHDICTAYKIPFSVSGRSSIAIQMSADLHLPFSRINELQKLAGQFKTIGVSIHSIDEAAAAEKAGASYLIVGHIFTTDCKPGLPPRGLSFLKEVCSAVHIPVYGIGGINLKNLSQVRAQGAKGGCMMSGVMKL